MALTVSQGFGIFLERLTPLQSERDAKARHRLSVETSLKGSTRFGVQLFRETGSFTHGTGIRNHCDVDLLVSMSGSQPTSDTALNWVKDALKASFPTTAVEIRRPTVVVRFAGGVEQWEILPVFRTSSQSETPIYDIPGPASGWMSSAPTAHLDYVNSTNQQVGVVGGTKKLARLAKAWKYYNRVPISSFYLEMRAAQYMAAQKSFSAALYFCGYLEWLDKMDLADMNDPMGKAGRFSACSSVATRTIALSNLHTAATRARKVVTAEQYGNGQSAFDYLGLLFGGQFPKR
ncbi:nucleotidyltransferase domain-containing protein [Streptomyces griseus]|uniref:nucleotidyltransferase domain-containing protein n=1 Tax=Streptomyces griseus TaxID=1911 RepID=UPI00225B0280|nr:nucleotidyltransferase [Streptomyces griseus]MCX4708222.1 nucleotidyltransferase [Streptomyces griseus]